VELSPETCRVKPLRRINAIVASCWIYFTTMESTRFTAMYYSQHYVLHAVFTDAVSSFLRLADPHTSHLTLHVEIL